jgi:hypothetical protein
LNCEGKVKYLLLAYRDEERWAAMSTSERDAFAQACLSNDERLREGGHLLTGMGLQSGDSAATVQLQDGEVWVTGGPFVETTKQLTGIFFIEARDLNNAIYVASTMPQAQGGAVEVRPVIESGK